MSYAGAVTNVIGGEMQGWAAKLAQMATTEEMQNELKRQSGFRRDATGQLFQYLPQLGAEYAGQQLTQGADARNARYAEGYAAPLVAGMEKKGQAGDAAAIELMGKERAKLGAYGDWQSNQSIGDSRLQEQLNRVYSKSGGQASIFPYRLQRAQHSQDMLAAIGQMISSIGGGSTNFSQLYGGSAAGQQQQGYTASQGVNFSNTPYLGNASGNGYMDYNAPNTSGNGFTTIG